MKHKTPMKYHIILIKLAKIKLVPSAGKDMDQWKPHPLLVGVLTGRVSLQKSLALSSKGRICV